MNRKKHLYSLLLVCLLPMQRALAEEQQLVVEKRKTIVKVYDVNSRDNLAIDNQFGDVKVNLWDRNEIRVDISVKANAPSDEGAERYLSAVDITERRNGDQISLKTLINRGSYNGQNRAITIIRNVRDGSNKSGVQVDYQISMPRNNALIVKNQFGNTHIPNFRAPLTIVNEHGNFYATDLRGDKIDIDVKFGTAEIGALESAKLDFQHSKLVLDKVNVLNLTNKHGNMQIGDVGTLNATIGYSPVQIGTLRESCKINVEFSNVFKIDQFNRSAENIDIQAAYSSVALPALAEGNLQFDVTVQHGGFRYPSDNSKIILKTQPNQESNRYHYQSTKQYTGQVGKGSGAKVRVVSRFSDVKFQ
ncbi:hypothetical protein [Tellurirhabdus bombi]|uniref:hypothetical protein n=1 Tax=Tellurirhabdus bombi TaxID=2907205 RepID=UPI001F3BD8D9|nr:hypothetical protein [Tellurirhabdus bombi]